MILVSQIIKQIKLAKVYKIAIISGIVTQLFFAIFKNYILIAFVGSNEQLSPMSAIQTTSYIWLTQILFSIVPWTINRQDFDSIRTGRVAIDLIRPTSIFYIIFTKTISWKFVGILTRGVPIFLVAIVLLSVFPIMSLQINIPNFTYFLMFIISVMFSILLSTLITTSLYCLAFYFTSITNFVNTIGSIAYVLSGMVIPLSFFPHYILNILNVQPFRYIVDMPALIFNGLYNIEDSLIGILGQMIWILIFYAINSRLYRNIETKIEINGG